MDIKNKHQLYKSDIDLLNEIDIVDCKNNMITSNIKSKFQLTLLLLIMHSRGNF